MFSKIFDFRYERTRLQAFGFYLCHIVIFLLLAGMVLGFLMAAGVMGDTEAAHILAQQEEIARVLGPVLGLTHALGMTILMLKAKGLDRSRNHVLVGALAIVLGGLAGPLVSLILVSWLSTREAVPSFGAK